MIKRMFAILAAIIFRKDRKDHSIKYKRIVIKNGQKDVEPIKEERRKEKKSKQ